MLGISGLSGRRTPSGPPPAPGSAWVAAALQWLFSVDDGDTRIPPTPEQFAETWPQALAGLHRHRVHGMFSAHADALGMPAGPATRLRQWHRQEAAAALGTVASTAKVADVLADAGIRALMVKGVALAALQDRDPASRGRGDVDIWVHPDDREAAVAALVAAGYERRPLQHRQVGPEDGWRYRFQSWATPELVLEHPSMSDVDLHWRLMRSPADLAISFDDAWERRVALARLGTNVHTLSHLDALAHVAHHGTKDAWSILRHVVDVTTLVRAALAGGQVSPDALHSLASGDVQVAMALHLAGRIDMTLGSALPTDGRNARRAERLARTAWCECLASRLRLADRRAASGWNDARLRVALTWWQVRSAPSAAAALHPVAELVLPMKAIMAAGPFPVSLVRQLTGRLG